MSGEIIFYPETGKIISGIKCTVTVEENNCVRNGEKSRYFTVRN